MNRNSAIFIGIVILVIIKLFFSRKEHFRYYDSSMMLPSMLNNQPNFGSMLDNSAPGR